MNTATPFPFGIPNRKEFNQHHYDTYGERIFNIVLPDQREAEIVAERYGVTPNGTLTFFSREEDRPVMSLAAGSWVSVYAASWLDGAPVIMASLPEELPDGGISLSEALK